MLCLGRLSSFALAAVLLTALPVMAGNITVDEMIFPDGNGDTAYSGDVCMSYDDGSNELTITLQNTTDDTAASDADIFPLSQRTLSQCIRPWQNSRSHE